MGLDCFLQPSKQTYLYFVELFSIKAWRVTTEDLALQTAACSGLSPFWQSLLLQYPLQLSPVTDRVCVMFVVFVTLTLVSLVQKLSVNNHD